MKARRIIYVDATVSLDGVCKISLYDKQNNASAILELLGVRGSAQAEGYAVLYAIMYVIKHNYTNTHILCDNLSIANMKKIQNFCKEKKIGLSWIPREINVVADKITKLEPTVKSTEWYILDMFYGLLFNQ